MVSTAGYVPDEAPGGRLLDGERGRGPAAHPGGRSARSATSRSTPRARAILQAADLDHDGSLSAEEAAQASALFVKAAGAEARPRRSMRQSSPAR